MSSPTEDTANGSPSLPTKRKSSAVDEIEVDLAAPEPPSKRARRAIKKGKPLPPKPDSDDDDNEKADGKDKREKKARSEHSVWIGNLPFTLTGMELRKWLVDHSGGVIADEAVTRVKLPMGRRTEEEKEQKKGKPANKGFAYVDFADIGSKTAAVALSETDLQGRRLLIKDATSFEGRPKKEEEAGDNVDGADARPRDKKESNASRKVFVGNMSFQTTEEDLRRNFEKCGEIEWVKMAAFEDTGKCKGYGWITFREPEAAAWAVKGFVKIKEQVETEDDFKADDSSSEGEEDNGSRQQQQRQFKTRKWWVNRMLGRELKLELAEDDQTRYRKRFGKDAKKGEEGAAATMQMNGDRAARMPRRDREVADRPLKEEVDINVARLTGALVKPTGTKVTFD